VDADTPEDEIVCVDCGGRCFLLTHARDDGLWWAGDIVSYRCRDCLDRWDIELPPADDAHG
jgi:DNA-directed RNA polymerase subunit RPC12/RpoP